MNKIAICILVIIPFSYKGFHSCSNKPVYDQVRAVHVISNLPVVGWDSSITEVNTYYDVFYYRNFIMYSFLYRFDSIVNGKRLLQEYRNYFFVFRKDSLFGYVYYPKLNHTMPEGRLSVDSVLTSSSYESNVYDSLLYLKPDSSYYNAEKNLVRVYHHPPKKGNPENYNLFLYYTTKLKGVKETFSKKLDNVKNMKLFRIRILADEAYHEEYKMTLPKREILLEMKEIPIENQEQVLSYFNEYKKRLLN